MLESKYQRDLIEKLEGMFPGCLILKNNPDDIQGIPDLLVLYGSKWGALEVKASRDAETQPNQPYYVDRMDLMSFASFIYPEIEKDVLHALQQALTSSESPLVS